MFTGIITHTVDVLKSQSTSSGMLLRIKKPRDWDDLVLGESIAMNGVCLTVTAIHEDDYECQLVAETLAKTSFGREVPERLNAERAMRAEDKFGGHFVQGHVDTAGKVSAVDVSAGLVLSVRFPEEFMELVVAKGSIVIDGISLTVASLRGNVCSVAIIPFTKTHTTIADRAVGDFVNIEFDMIGKYVVQTIKAREAHEKTA